jgi:hypothetical protein
VEPRHCHLVTSLKDSKEKPANKNKSAFEGPNLSSKVVIKNCKEIKGKTTKRQKDNQVKEDSYHGEKDFIVPNEVSDNKMREE